MKCAWFVFSDFLQAELDKMKEKWNTHRIRRSRYAKVAGIPDEMHFLTEYYGYKNCGNIIYTEKNKLCTRWERRTFLGSSFVEHF